MKKIYLFIFIVLSIYHTAKTQTRYGTNSGTRGGDLNAYFGVSAGEHNYSTAYYNTFIGAWSGNNNTSGNYNTFLGHASGLYTNSGSNNTFIGHAAGFDNTTGYENTFLGSLSGRDITIGHRNTFVGYRSGYNAVSGDYNVFLGYYTGQHNASGNYNTFLGTNAGRSATGSSNVFIGYTAGYHETGSNKLYIDNTTTSAPLIWGDFSANLININGKLGVGTTTPYAKLDVNDGGARIQLGNISGGGLSGNFRGVRTYWDSDMAFFGLRDYGSDRKDVIINNEQASDNIRLQIAGADKVFVGGNGKIGIGTAAPAFKLHTIGDIYADGGWLRVSGNNGLYFQNHGGGFYMKDATWIRTHGNKNFYHNTGIMRTDGELRVGPNGNRLRVSADGKVGIGTTSPKEKLHVAGNIFADMGEGFRIFGNINYFGQYQDGIVFQMQDGNATNGATDGGFVFRGYTPTDDIAKDWMVIKSGGNVGIGTTTPAAPLSFANTTGNKIDLLYGTGGNGDRYGLGVFPSELRIHSGAGGSDSGGITFGKQSTATFTEFVRFTNTGNVGIGTASPTHKLHVNGDTYLSGEVTVGETPTESFAMGATDAGAYFETDLPLFEFNKGIEVKTGRISSGDADLIFQTDDVTRMTVSGTDGDVTIDNNLIVGKTIKFNASILTQDNNVDELMVIRDDGSLATRSVMSIESPWMIMELLNIEEGDTTLMICPDSAMVGTRFIDLIDLNGNLRIGDEAYFDDDTDFGGIGDDWMRFNGRIEFSSSGNKHGIVLYDQNTYIDYTNIYHEGGSTYLANDNDADSYFLKSTGRDVEFGGQVTIPELNTQQLSSATSLVVTIDNNNDSDAEAFAVRSNGDVAYTALFTVADSGHVTVPVGNLSVTTGNLDAVDATFSRVLYAGDAELSGSLTATGDITAANASLSGTLTAMGNVNAVNATFSGTLGASATSAGTLTATTVRATALPVAASAQKLVTVDASGNLEAYAVANGFDYWRNVGGILSYTGSDVATAHLAVKSGTTAAPALRVVDTHSGHDVFRVYNDGFVRAKKLELMLDGWHDAVFEPDYKLRPLDDLEQFVKENKHLPDIPSEKEVLTDGVEVGEIQGLLLKKIEELTLYLMEEHKSNKALQQQVEQLTKEVSTLKQLATDH